MLLSVLFNTVLQKVEGKWNLRNMLMSYDILGQNNFRIYFLLNSIHLEYCWIPFQCLDSAFDIQDFIGPYLSKLYTARSPHNSIDGANSVLGHKANQEQNPPLSEWHNRITQML